MDYSRNYENTLDSGYLLVDKSVGLTSHDVVAKVRAGFNKIKTGHAGTLDPGASGLLILLVGREATKQSDQLRGLDKTYQITMEFGYSTDTLDQDGIVNHRIDPSDIRLNQLNEKVANETLLSFIKTYEQQVPLFSAVKVKGNKLYDIGYKKRQLDKGDMPILPSRMVTIFSIHDMSFNTTNTYPELMFTAHVSSGTYTRSLVRDIGESLKLPATQVSLRRTSIGPFLINEAKQLDEICKDDIIPLSQLRELLSAYGAIV